MEIAGKKYEQIVVTRNQPGRLVTADEGKEVIAIISDEEVVIVKNGYKVKLVAEKEAT